MTSVPQCPVCGQLRWYALRNESVVSEADLDATSAAFGEEIQIDGELGDLEMRCRGCDHTAGDDDLEALETLYYA